MRKNYFLLFAMAVAAVSCTKDFGGDGGKTVNTVTIPADFNWLTTRDAQVTVEAPQVDGQAPQYAVVRVYASPVLTDANLVAKGVTTAATPFRTALTIPAGAENLYVKTTLPDGSSTVKAVAATGAASVAGVSVKSLARAMSGIRVAAAAEVVPDMPDYPTMELKTAADFAPEAVIETTPKSVYQLGASWGGGQAAYYIPAGSEITANIDLYGHFDPCPDPVLYVAGKLTMKYLQIGAARLAVLPGGEVTIENLSASDSGSAEKPAIYVFEGGTVKIQNINFSGKSMVNCGAFNVTDEFDMNGSGMFYNTTTAAFETSNDLKCSGSVAIYNDGKFTVLDEMDLNNETRCENRSNGVMKVRDLDLENGGSTFYQMGKAELSELDVTNGTCYINCYTYAEKVEAENAKYFLSRGACLESLKAEFNNTHIDMAAGALFITQRYVDDHHHGNVKFRGPQTGDEFAVLRIEQKLEVEKTDFSGNLEVVFPEGTKVHKFEKQLKKPAFASLEQTTNIPATECNGGKGEITPEPEPEPTEEYEVQPGAVYTYCFEDMWPRLGDYDMNDAVVVCSIDRNQSKDGGKVASVIVNWELKAAGTERKVGFALRMTGIAASEVESVVSTCPAFGSGFFASQQPEAGSDKAVIPFFNDTKDLLTSSNTWIGHTPAVTTKYKTTVTFTQPVESEKVRESGMDFFIVVNERKQEIHMPVFQPTMLGELMPGSYLSSVPYKFYVEENNSQCGNNFMMWVLQIPGDFRYPAETNDIRMVYENFNAWAASGGVSHPYWYQEEAEEGKIF